MQKGISSKQSAIFNILNECEEFILDKNGIILSSNLEAVTVTGYDEWEIIGKHFTIFYTQQDYFKEQHLYDLHVMKSQGKVVVERIMLKRKSVSFWANVTLELLPQPTDSQACYRLKIRDNTTKVLVHAETDKIKKEYERLLENSFTGIIRFRFSSGEIISLNERGLEILDKRAAFPKLISEIFHIKAECREFKKTLLRNKKLNSFEFKIAGTSNIWHWGSLTCSLFADDDIVEGILQDITERKLHIIELERLNHELQMFIYHSSHDLRAPLTSILGLTNLISIETSFSKCLEYSRLIEKRIKDIDGVLRGIVSIALNNSSDLEYAEFHIEEELKFLVNEFREFPVKTSFEVTGGKVISTDPVRLRIILRNLWSNALQFHDSGLPEAKLHFSVNTTESIITVEDNGIGIDPAIKDKVFSMFYRGSTQSRGAGLGLYIVKSILDKMGGAIQINSKSGEGSKFIVVLPHQNGGEVTL